MMYHNPSRAARSTASAVRMRARLAASLGVCGAWMGLVLVSLSAAGCQHRNLANERVQMHQERMAETIEVARASEQGRPAKYQESLGFAEAYFAHQAERFDANKAEAERLMQRDVQRGAERLSTYSADAVRILWGHPERIDYTACFMF